MAEKKLYAKDRRRQLNRRVGTLLVGGLGLGALGWLVYELYQRVWVSRPMAPGARKDWSGCGTPPSDIPETPGYNCGDRVSWEGTNYKVLNRSWSSAEGYQGVWVYGISKGGVGLFEDEQIEEANLSPPAAEA